MSQTLSDGEAVKKLRSNTSYKVFSIGDRHPCTKGAISPYGDILFVVSKDTIHVFNIISEVKIGEISTSLGQINDISYYENDDDAEGTLVVSATGGYALYSISIDNSKSDYFSYSTYVKLEKTLSINNEDTYFKDGVFTSQRKVDGSQPPKSNESDAKSTTEDVAEDPFPITAEMFSGCDIFNKGLWAISTYEKPFRREDYAYVFERVDEDSIKLSYSIKLDGAPSSLLMPDRDFLIISMEDGRILCYKLRFGNPELVQNLDVARKTINKLTMTRDKKILIASSEDQAVYMYLINSRECKISQFGKTNAIQHKYQVSCSVISPKYNDDSDRIPHVFVASTTELRKVAFTKTDYPLSIYNLITKRETNRITSMFSSPLNWIGITPDGRTLIVTAQEGSVAIIRLGVDYETLVKEQQEIINDLGKK